MERKAKKEETPKWAWGWCVATTDDEGKVLDAWFPNPSVGDLTQKSKAVEEASNQGEPEYLLEISTPDYVRNVLRQTFFVISDLAHEPNDAKDVYLRLHILSLRFVMPNTINLENIFTKLENVVWTDMGPCKVANFNEIKLNMIREYGNAPTVMLVDKIPRMVDFVVPSGVRIANADRVRLGAYLSEGTTVMHEGFCNYNAGTLGVSMVEGRISQGVIVGDGSDIGGGASIMGTLSGGGKEVVSIGKRSLLGANAGLGFPLGDDCVVEAGLYITSGTKVLFEGEIFKAKELSYANGLLFRRNSLTGIIEAVRRNGAVGIELNGQLHQN